MALRWARELDNVFSMIAKGRSARDPKITLGALMVARSALDAAIARLSAELQEGENDI